MAGAGVCCEEEKSVENIQNRQCQQRKRNRGIIERFGFAEMNLDSEIPEKIQNS